MTMEKVETKPCLFVRFDRGRDSVWGPTFGPFEYVQQTYTTLRVSPDGDIFLAQLIVDAGEWFIFDGFGHDDEFYSDFTVFSSTEEEEKNANADHVCESARVTIGNDGATEQRWDHEKKVWVPTGRVWDSSKGAWT